MEHTCCYCKKTFAYDESNVQCSADYEVGSGGPITETKYVRCTICCTDNLISEEVVG